MTMNRQETRIGNNIYYSYLGNDGLFYDVKYTILKYRNNLSRNDVWDIIKYEQAKGAK
jgi:hypothetical protein